jgi:NRPS condensation-like uncharacterized protein
MHDAPQYKIYLVSDYQPGQSAIVIKIHHNMTDGLGIATFFQCLNGNYDTTALPSMKPIPFYKRFLIFLISPILCIYTFMVFQMMSVERNALLKDEPISGKKTYGYVRDLDVAKMKAYCKNNRCTINDYCAAIFSWTLAAYLKLEETRAIEQKKLAYKVPKTVRLAIPFSFRQPFKKLSDVKMTNDFGSLFVDLKTCDNFEASLKDCVSVFNKLKTSLMPFGILYLTKIPALFPFSIPKFL